MADTHINDVSTDKLYLLSSAYTPTAKNSANISLIDTDSWANVLGRRLYG